MTNRILLVDDERSIRESLGKILRAESYEVVLADNGEEAIQKHGAQCIDLLILDLNMPLKNGWLTLRSLVESNPLLPIIIITGRANQRILAEKGGADVLMEKPLDVRLLLQTIRNLLSEPLESRVQRASDRASNFRRLSSDEEPSRETLLERFTRRDHER
jgi:DNA-binding response OmpR family regulator